MVTQTERGATNQLKKLVDFFLVGAGSDEFKDTGEIPLKALMTIVPAELGGGVFLVLLGLDDSLGIFVATGNLKSLGLIVFAGDAVVRIFTPARFPFFETENELDARGDDGDANHIIFAVLTGVPFILCEKSATADSDTDLSFFVGSVALSEDAFSLFRLGCENVFELALIRLV